MDHNYYTDHLGMVVFLVDENGRKVGEYEYSPFGEVLIAKGGRAKHNFYTFTGREYLERLGMYDYRARIYDPRPGRFVEMEPECNQCIDKFICSQYLYAKNNPIAFTDPSGKLAWWVWVAIGVTVLYTAGPPLVMAVIGDCSCSPWYTMKGKKIQVFKLGNLNINCCVCSKWLIYWQCYLECWNEGSPVRKK